MVPHPQSHSEGPSMKVSNIFIYNNFIKASKGIPNA